MNRTFFGDLYEKVFRSGNPLFFLIGINVLVFIVLGLVGTFEFLGSGSTSIANFLELHLSVPAAISKVPGKFWTAATYMVTQRNFFHLLFNMLWLYWLGRIFLDFLNNRQFIFTYLAGGLAGVVLYLLAYNLIPVFSATAERSYMLGSSASVMAIVIATATLLPNYTIQLLFFGGVRLKYLALVYFILDIIGISGPSAGGNIAHIGGAILGFLFVKQLNRGNDWSKLFQRKSKLKVATRQGGRRQQSVPDQDAIDRILDKISRSGYDSLTSSEKEELFRASKK